MKYLVVAEIDGPEGTHPKVDEIFEAEDYGYSISTLKYLISHGRIVTYHEGM